MARAPSALERLAVRGILRACHGGARVVGQLHAAAVRLRVLRVPPIIRTCPSGLRNCLVRVWSARLTREVSAGLMKTPLRQAILERVLWEEPPESQAGAVLAILHSPWARLMAAWCADHEYARVVAGGSWARRAGRMSAPVGVRGLRSLIRHLQAGGRVAVVVDTFPVGGSPARFLGERVEASLLAARIASLAEVVVVPVLFFWQGDRLTGRFGPTRTVSRRRGDHVEATDSALSFLEEEVLRDPSVWNNALKERSLW